MKPNQTILFVDDLAMFRELGERFLSQSGRVITASDGHEALAQAIEERPALVFTDLHMPGMNGADLCRSIKSHPDLYETPVVMILSTGNMGERRLALRAGADDLIRKPLSRPLLVEAVHRALRYGVMRDLPRVSLEEPVRMMATAGESQGTARNLSRRGIFVETPLELPMQTLVNLHFTLPQSPTDLVPVAQVMWTRVGDSGPPGMGMRFIQLDGGTAQHLEEFVFERSLSDQAEMAGIAT